MNISNKQLKKRILEISYKKKLAHIGSCLTELFLLIEIYEKKKPDEKVILSNGHSHLAHLVCREYFEGVGNIEELLVQNGIHCDRSVGCDVSAGSLGHGIGIAVGIALADRSKKVWCTLSDGECSEGSVHEALRIKDELKLDNLKVYINFNTYGAYKKIDTLHLAPEGIEKIKVVRTGKAVVPFPFLHGQIGHYVALNEDQYKLAMEILQ